MNDTLKAFMEQARQDPALAARVQDLAALPPAEAEAALAALAAEQGFIPQELDEDELDAVAGGLLASAQGKPLPPFPCYPMGDSVCSGSAEDAGGFSFICLDPGNA